MQNTLTLTSKTNIFQPTILIIDNKKDHLTDIATALESLNYHCLTAQTTMMGLALAQQHQPDLILLNVEMPTMSGIELLQTLRLDWLTRTIPVIALATLESAKKYSQSILASFDGYLYQPCISQDLKSVVCQQIACEALP